MNGVEQTAADNLVRLLTGHGESVTDEERLYELCNSIQNIVNSYDDELDALTELVQNALDAMQARLEADPEWSDDLLLEVVVDTTTGELRVSDNGTGIAWVDHSLAMKPNYSLKRRLGQKSSRGEKGAALTFLQFGHDGLNLETTHLNGDHWRYSLAKGRAWYEQTVETLESDNMWDEKWSTLQDVDFDLEKLDEGTSAGTSVVIHLPKSLFTRVLGGDSAKAKLRLEYLLRTRTGVGFFVMDGNRDKLELWQRRLKVRASIIHPGGTETFSVKTGFFYPHELAKRAGSRKTSLMTASGANNELIYEYFDIDWLTKHVPETLQRADVKAVLEKYEVRGYVSYAHQNDWYETATGSLLGFSIEDATADLQESLIQVNGGFLVSVREFPTGRRKQFLHRSGAEHKSRTFVVADFGKDYKPDYGRKNLAADAHPMMLELCKRLISNASARRTMLSRPKGESTHAAQSIDDARQSLSELADALRARGVWMVSGNALVERTPETEMEVVVDFLSHIAAGSLPGFSIYGLLAKGMLDGYFDYELPVSEQRQYLKEACPLGVSFKEGKPRKYTGEWLEFKTTSDKLVDDFERPVGTPSKKFFGLTQLLVCERVDDATDDYEIVPIDEHNYDERRFFGVTHLLRSSKNAEHVVQVISLSDLRSTLEVQPHGTGAEGFVE